MSAPSKEQFYQDLNADTFCGYQWCKQLYGYHLGNEGFVEHVFARLDELGREGVKAIYGLYVKWEMDDYLNACKVGAGDARERIDRNYERQVRECEKNQQMTNYLANLSDEEIIRMLRERQI